MPKLFLMMMAWTWTVDHQHQKSSSGERDEEAESDEGRAGWQVGIVVGWIVSMLKSCLFLSKAHAKV